MKKIIFFYLFIWLFLTYLFFFFMTIPSYEKIIDIVKEKAVLERTRVEIEYLGGNQAIRHPLTPAELNKKVDKFNDEIESYQIQLFGSIFALMAITFFVTVIISFLLYNKQKNELKA